MQGGNDMQQKRIPMRQCVGCREMKDKKSLLRVVKSPEGEVSLDFGGKKPMPGADMERQLGATSRLLSQKAIHGVIFHCTPLVDMNLDAVNVSRAWIKENGPKKWGA